MPVNLLALFWHCFGTTDLWGAAIFYVALCALGPVGGVMGGSRKAMTGAIAVVMVAAGAFCRPQPLWRDNLGEKLGRSG